MIKLLPEMTVFWSIFFVTEICDLPSSIQQLLFNELLDQDVQKGKSKHG